jgi:hypothetical protein
MSTTWQLPFREAVAAFLTATQPTAAVSPDQIHLLVPVERWDWGVAPTGETSTGQITFCDTMPQSCAPGTDYAPSSDNFSGAYASFVDLLVDFSPAALRETVQAALATPPGDPASRSSPPGWSKTEDGAGMLRWALDWIVAMSPAAWATANAARHTEASELDAVTSVQLLDSASKTVAVPTATGEALTLAGSGWSRVPMYPGSWYSGSLVGLGRGGPFAGSRAPATVVGPEGILRCRVAELIVATDVSVTASLSSAIDLAAFTRIQLGPISADPASAVAGSGTMTVATPPGDPYLVGVIYAQP